MAKKKMGLSKLVNFVAWLTGVIVSLAVGFSLISLEAGTLSLPSWLGGATVAMIAGWIVVISTFLGIAMAIFNR